MPPAPGESRPHQVHQHLHDGLSVIQDPRHEFMTHAERGHRHEGNRKLVKVKAKKPTAPPRGGAEAGHDLGGSWPWTLTWRRSTFLCALSITQQQSALSGVIASPPHVSLRLPIMSPPPVLSSSEDLPAWDVPSEQGGKFSLLISCWNKTTTVQRSKVNQLQRGEVRGEEQRIDGADRCQASLVDDRD